MSKKKPEQPSKIVMLAPVALVLIIYSFLIHMPQQSELQAKQQRLNKLMETQHDIQHDLEDTQLAAVKLKKELRGVESELTDLQKHQNELQARINRIRIETVRPSRPAATMQQVTGLMEQHRMLVLESLPDSDAADHADKVLQPLLNLLFDKTAKTSPSQANKKGDREIYQLKLRGRFRDLQAALSSLKDQIEHVLPLSLQMESLDVESTETRRPERVWTLTIMV